MKNDAPGIHIDESSHKPAPDLLTKFKNSLKALGMGFILAQVVLFTIGLRSFVLWWDNIFFLMYLLACSILGWIVGDRFIETLGKKTES